MPQWLRPLIRAALLCAALLGAAGCAALPSGQQVRQFLGVEPAFAHNDVPAPPSADAFALQFALGQTRRIVVHATKGRPAYEVTDPQTIASVVAVLRAGPRASPAPGAAPLQEPLLIDFIAGPPDRVVTAHYSPQRQTLQLFNVPTAAWPDHAVGRYTLPPSFGAALRDALAPPP